MLGRSKNTYDEYSVQSRLSPQQTIRDAGAIDLRTILLILKRRKSIIFGITIMAMILATVFAYVQTPRYTAESVLQFNLRQQEVVDIKSMTSGLVGNDPSINSELDIIKSRHLAGSIYDKLKLADNREFRKEFIEDSSVEKVIESFKPDFLKSDEDGVFEQKELERRQRMKAIDGILENLRIARDPRSYTVKIKFTSESAELSTLMANAISDEYLVNDLEMKFSATRRANEWLRDRVAELQKKVNESENAVHLFKEKYDLIKLSGQTVNDKQLSELNSQLILARTELAQAEARLKQSIELSTSEDGVESAVEVMASPLIQKLKEQEVQVLQEKSELESRYGDRHPMMIKIRAELHNIKEKIDSETRKVIQGLKHEVEIAGTKVFTLEESLKGLQDKSNVTNRAEIQLSELVRQMETDLALYESFLTRFKETSNQNLEQSIAKVINRAEIPLKPSYPRKAIILLIAVIFGFCLGVMLAFVVEHLDNGFRSAEQIEEVLDIPEIGMVPQLNKKIDATKYAVQKPTSAFAESLRSVMTAVHFSNPDNPPKSIMVTSSVPNEGKSTFAIALARMTAASGHKVLLIDCDMRRPTVFKAFEKVAEKGLEDMLSGAADVKEVVMRDEESGLHYIRSFPDTPHSQELLGSKKMKDFVKKVSGIYDTVILDSPPVMALSDPLMLSKAVDTSIFVVQWEKTPRYLVRSALRKFLSTGAPLSGIILSRVNIEKHKKYGFGDYGSYYGHYKGYYSD